MRKFPTTRTTVLLLADTVWAKEGEKNATDKAREKALKILDDHSVPEMDRNLSDELERIVSASNRE